jgi:hypothetical protein
MKQPTQKTVLIRQHLANKLSPDEVAIAMGIPKGDVMAIVYKDRHAEKKRKIKAGKVRSYVRRVPRHPDKTQVINEHERGMRGASDRVEPSSGQATTNRLKAISALQNELDFVRGQFAEAFRKNQDLYNEIKDLQAVIKYLEAQVVNLIKSN